MLFLKLPENQMENHSEPLFNTSVLKDLVTMEMPFGKYKGTLICDLPEFYLVWFSRKGFPAGKLGMLLSTMYEIKLN